MIDGNFGNVSSDVLFSKSRVSTKTVVKFAFIIFYSVTATFGKSYQDRAA